MIKINRNSTYLEVKEFLEDIYMHLSNHLDPPTDSNVADAQQQQRQHQQQQARKELINRCRHILNIFEIEFDQSAPATVGSDQPYLDMTAHKKASSEYVDVDPEIMVITNDTTDAAEDNVPNADLYEDCAFEQQSHSSPAANSMPSLLSCPFSGLPATHLSIKNATKIGYLQKIERRLFFDQTKKFYAGILEGWLLLYSSLTDLKPTISMKLSQFTLEKPLDATNTSESSPKKRSEFLMQLTADEPNNVKKKCQFQFNSKQEWEEWMEAIDRLVISSNSQFIRPRVNTFNSSCRKLPTPPLSTLSTTKTSILPITTTQVAIYANQRSSNRSEDIYEEPAEMKIAMENAKSNDLDNQHYEAPDKATVDCFNDDFNPFDYDVPRSPPKCIENLRCHEQIVTPSQPSNKFEEVKSILSTQLLSSPAINKNYKQPITSDIPVVASVPAIKKKDENTTSRKSWFRSRLTKVSTTQSGKTSVKISITKESTGNGSKLSLPATDVTVAAATVIPTVKITCAAAKSGKVNMIINQLEANGHLPIFSKNL